MINIFPFEELGNHNYGWLNAHYHFNFADYFHPEKMGYPPLLVWNEDQIKPGTGFPMHSHKNMEIITYVRKGVITHEDSLGNKGITRAGEIQVMSAGSGITHSEYNAEETETHLFQIWIQPNMVNIKPRWKTVNTKFGNQTELYVLASGQKDIWNPSLIQIHQNATLYLIKGRKNEQIDYTVDNERQIYFVISEGNLFLNKNKIELRSGVYIQKEKQLYFDFIEDSEIVFFDLPEF